MRDLPVPPSDPQAATKAFMAALQTHAIERLPDGADPVVLPMPAVEGEVLGLAHAYQAELDRRRDLLEEGAEALKDAGAEIESLSAQVEALEEQLGDSREAGGLRKRVEELEESLRSVRRTANLALKPKRRRRAGASR